MKVDGLPERTGNVLSVGDLFPPEGHRYYTDDQIELLRQAALGGDDVTLTSYAAIALVCDWRNMTQELGRTSDQTGGD